MRDVGWMGKRVGNWIGRGGKGFGHVPWRVSGANGACDD